MLSGAKSEVSEAKRQVSTQDVAVFPVAVSEINVI